jgi:predicted RNA binding protein YcfA (HicA-like mRNA interferase family)
LPKLPRTSGKKLAAALRKAGFDMPRGEGGHGTFHNPHTGHVTTVPLTNKTLPVGTIAVILKQAGVTPDELRRLL